MLINQDLNQTQAPSPQQAIKSYGRPGSPKRLVGVPVAARSTQPYRVTLQAFAVVERVQAFQRVEVGWSQTCGHTSRRQLLAAEMVLTSTRVNAFDLQQPRSVCSGVGLSLPWPPAVLERGQQRDRDCRWLERTDRAPMSWICSA